MQPDECHISGFLAFLTIVLHIATCDLRHQAATMKLDIDAQAAKAVALLEGLNNAPVEGIPAGSETAPHGTLKFSGGGRIILEV